MRVIAGKFGSRRLQSLPGMDIRPTSDRLRETLFDVLCGGNLDRLAGTVWLDLYAGTGAVGIEALSRGAAQVTFVENSRKAAALIEKNLKSLGISRGFAVLTTEVVSGLRKLETCGATAEYIFLDPPYRLESEYQSTLQVLAEGRIVSSSTIVVAEHDRRLDPGDKVGNLARYRALKQGDAALSFYRRV